MVSYRTPEGRRGCGQVETIQNLACRVSTSTWELQAGCGNKTSSVGPLAFNLPAAGIRAAIQVMFVASTMIGDPKSSTQEFSFELTLTTSCRDLYVFLIVHTPISEKVPARAAALGLEHPHRPAFPIVTSPMTTDNQYRSLTTAPWLPFSYQ